MIEAQNLTKRYGKAVAFDNVSLVVRPGRVTGFLGPQRGRQVDHHAHDHWAGHSELRIGPCRRQGPQPCER